LEGRGVRTVSHGFNKIEDGNSKRIIKEKQELPYKPSGEAFMDKIKEGADDEV
jgi:hypothetical protein